MLVSISSRTLCVDTVVPGSEQVAGGLTWVAVVRSAQDHSANMQWHAGEQQGIADTRAVPSWSVPAAISIFGGAGRLFA